MNTGNGQTEPEISPQGALLRAQEGDTTPNYGGVGQGPHPSATQQIQQPLPLYHAPPGFFNRQHEEINYNGCFSWSWPLSFITFVVAFVFLSLKTEAYIDARAQLLTQQVAMRAEETRLNEAWLSWKNERSALKEEREKWEKARDETRVPQGGFWEVVWPKWECRAYGKREYWGILRNVPQDRNEFDACMNMPVEIRGVTVKRPDRCEYVERSPYIHAFWLVDWDQPDCKPWHKDFRDKGCTNPGSGIRRIEAEVEGINKKGQQDWHVLCETTPMTWDHITYSSPTHCEERDGEKKFAVWDIPDDRC